MHITVMGQGPDLVMLHGWSMNSGVWHDLAERLAKDFTLHLVDLPGHGLSDWQPGDFDIDILLETLAKQVPDTAYYIGWSLGGLISLAFAHQFNNRVKKLILLAATPRFVQADGWPCAMQATVFQDFADKLDDNQAETLQRFLLLQARGSKHSRDTIKKLAEQLALVQPPNAHALKAGLDLLITMDIRSQLASLNCPMKMILGERDTLIPNEMLAMAKQINPHMETTVIAGAGHAPFISHADECLQQISQFLGLESIDD